jgi:hypothetical protein
MSKDAKAVVDAWNGISHEELLPWGHSMGADGRLLLHTPEGTFDYATGEPIVSDAPVYVCDLTTGKWREQ